MKYTYKNKPYKILYESQIKLGGVWIDAIVYECQYENPDGKVWVRTKEEFFRLFSEVIEKEALTNAAKFVDKVNADPTLKLHNNDGTWNEKDSVRASLQVPIKYSVWMSGFMVQGMDSPEGASFIGTVEATSFAEAAEKALQQKGHDMKLFNKEHLTYWGCGLYDNQDDASKTFG